jgi:WD40 repeat protein
VETPKKTALSPAERVEADTKLRRLERATEPLKRIELAKKWLDRYSEHPSATRVRELLAADQATTPARVIEVGDGPTSMAFADRQTLAISGDRGITLCDVRTGEVRSHVPLKAGRGVPMAGVRGGVVLRGSAGSLTWVLNEGQEIVVTKTTVEALGASAARDRVAVTTRDGRLQLFEVGARTPRVDVDPSVGRVAAVCFSPSGERIGVLTSRFGPRLGSSEQNRMPSFFVFDLEGQLLHQVPMPMAPSCAAFHGEDQVLVGSYVGFLGSWGIESGERSGTFQGPNFQGSSREAGGSITRGSGLSLRGLAVLGDSVLWSLGSSRGRVPPPGRSARSSQFPVGGSELVRWNLETRSQMRVLERLPARGMVIGPDGKTLALSLTDGRVEIWDLAGR